MIPIDLQLHDELDALKAMILAMAARSAEAEAVAAENGCFLPRSPN